MVFKRYQVIFNLSKSLTFRFHSRFVPKHEPVQSSDANNLEHFVKEHNKILVLTGIIYYLLMIKLL